VTEPEALLRALVGEGAGPATDRYLEQLAQGQVAGDALAALLLRFEAKLARLEAVRNQSSRAIAREILAQTRTGRRGRGAAAGPLAGWSKLDGDGRRLALGSGVWSAVADHGHRLVWTVNDELGGDVPNPCRQVRWRSAQELLAALNVEAWCGHRDWRIPRIDELEALTATQDDSSDALISARLFPDLGRDRVYWSCNGVEGTRQLQAFDFRDGTIVACMPGDGAYVRFVRTMGDDED
jgi:hypothetical protein